MALPHRLSHAAGLFSPFTWLETIGGHYGPLRVLRPAGRDVEWYASLYTCGFLSALQQEEEHCMPAMLLRVVGAFDGNADPDDVEGPRETTGVVHKEGDGQLAPKHCEEQGTQEANLSSCLRGNQEDGQKMLRNRVSRLKKRRREVSCAASSRRRDTEKKEKESR